MKKKQYSEIGCHVGIVQLKYDTAASDIGVSRSEALA